MSTEDQQGEPLSLAKRVMRAAGFNAVAYVLMQVIRMVTNIVLARYFISKGDFGLVSVLLAVNIGLEMLSDVGIGAAIIQNDRGEEADFLNTAWTLHVVRGAGLTVVALLLVYPTAAILDMPKLLQLMPVTALVGVINGMHSTSVFTLQRRLAFGRLSAMEVAGQVCGSGGTLLIAMYEPSAWALVWGMLIRSTVDLIITHAVPVGYRNRFAWNRDDLRRIMHFGKWLFGSSALTFVGGEGHKLVLARPLGQEALGVYHIADLLGQAATNAVVQQTSTIGYSAYSEVSRDQPGRLKSVYYRSRRVLDALSQPAFGGLSALAPPIVLFLYGEGFREAGWMLQVLCLRGAMKAVASSGQYVLQARGVTRYSFFLNVGRVAWLVLCAPAGFALDGVRGVVWAVATVELPALLVTHYGMYRHELLSIRRELLAPAMFGVGWALGWGVRAYVLPLIGLGG